MDVDRIIDEIEQLQEMFEALLCAPTGRAAKRLTETTGLGSEDDPPPAGN